MSSTFITIAVAVLTTVYVALPSILKFLFPEAPPDLLTTLISQLQEIINLIYLAMGITVK